MLAQNDDSGKQENAEKKKPKNRVKSQERSLSRDDKQIRSKYMAQLAQKKVWLQPQQQPASHQCLIIFDWDDTILCTSYLATFQTVMTREDFYLPEPVREKLDLLD